MTKTLPAPLQDEIPYEMEGSAYRIFSGDCFEFGEAEQVHCIVLRGVDAPDEGQPYFLKSRSVLNGLVRLMKLRCRVVYRDEVTRESADVFVLDETSVEGKVKFNVGLKMIQLGFARYNGSQFEGAESFQIAQQDAQQKGLGIWSQASQSWSRDSNNAQAQGANRRSDQSDSSADERRENGA